MRRHAIGILALTLLIGSLVVLLQGDPEGLAYPVATNSLRAGALLAVLWLAYADVNRVPPWVWATFLPLLLAVLWKPRLLIFILPIGFLLAILHPRIWPKGRGRRVP